MIWVEDPVSKLQHAAAGTDARHTFCGGRLLIVNPVPTSLTPIPGVPHCEVCMGVALEIELIAAGKA